MKKKQKVLPTIKARKISHGGLYMDEKIPQ
jgi:hypothetical protein